MKAVPAHQRRLLDLADLDAELARRRHHLANLPETAQLQAVDAELATANDEVLRAQAAVDELAAEYDKVDAELTGAAEHAQRDQAKLDAGGLPPKVLAELQHEMTGLARRRDVLESDLLEIMERQEALGMELERAQAAVTALTERRTQTETARDQETAATENDVTEFLDRRAAIVAELPGDLVGVYEKLWAKGQVAAGLVRQRRCGACRMELDPRTLAAVAAAPEDEVVRCEECAAIMVRTEQSGLATPAGAGA